MKLVVGVKEKDTNSFHYIEHLVLGLDEALFWHLLEHLRGLVQPYTLHQISDISINGNGNRNGNDFFTEMESKNGNKLERELE